MNEGPNAYPEFRMRKLMEVCTSTLISRFQMEFTSEELWDAR